ncbi:MAG: long-chain fatty acid--CoA ligase, partial [bacterium]|nr:long-chain fatty acid--CoA ligase [bacterium]
MLFSKIHKVFGGKVRCIVSGAAPLDPEIYTFYDNIGFTVIEGYGLTETYAAIAVNSFTDRKPGSVGLPEYDQDIKINLPNEQGEGEICYGGKRIMKGYFRDQQGTDKVIRDGWFHTGDLGRFDEDGHLFISGRIKDIIVLPSGKKVMPERVEKEYAGIKGVLEIAV